MTGAAALALLLLVEGQSAPTVLEDGAIVKSLDDGALVGRVCEDADGDGLCGDGEAPISGARVVLETGATARTDEAGRYHLAGTAGRAPDRLGGGRLQPGRHRLKVDTRFLPPGSRVTPAGATVEVPMGALVQVDFAVRTPGRGAAPVEPDAAPPKVGLAPGGVRLELRVKAPEEISLRLGGQEAVRDGEAWRAEVTLPLGPALVPVSAASADGHVWLLAWRVDVIRRAVSTLVVPRAMEPVGRVELPTDRTAGLSIELPPGSRASVDGVEARLTDGRGVVALGEVERVRLALDVPGVGRWEETVELPRLRGVFAVGLLDVEATFDPARADFQLFGRGAGAARASLLGFEVSAELDLRDTDVEAVRSVGAGVLVGARRLDVFDRQLDQVRTPLSWADASATVATNAPEGRFRVEVAREGLGRAGYGAVRAFFGDTEVGRFHRALQGGYLEVKSPSGGRFGVEARGFAAPTTLDPVNALLRVAQHDRFEATGGSVLFLSRAGVVQGSELVRVEWRDAVTGLPVREQHLTRGRDYTLDASTGRLLLARPLSFFAAAGVLATEPLSAATSPVLAVDYEAVGPGVDGPGALGGEVRGRAGPVTAGGGYVHDGRYELLRGFARATLGPVWLGAEVARSSGSAGTLGWSRDGGFAWQERAAGAAGTGLAVTLRARGTGLWGRGFFDAAWRLRQAGFEDVGAVGALSQVSVRAEQPFGPVVVAALADVREGDDPRAPFTPRPLRARLLGGAVGYEGEALGVRLEVRDAQLATDPLGAGVADGGRLSAGLHGRYRVAPWLTLRAGYRHRLFQRGAGEGAWDDSFASAGAEVKLTDGGPEVGLRAGWGPALGFQAWGVGSWSRGDETWYGAHALDVDAPGAGDRRFAVGARRDVAPGTAVFVEDVAAQDVGGLRLARAVGLSQRLSDAMTLTGRYERGVRALVDAAPAASRDAGGVGLSWESSRVRLGVRAEARSEAPASGPGALSQWVATGGGELLVLPSLTAAGRLQFQHTTRDALMISRLVEAHLSLAWRFGPGTVVARYAYQQEAFAAAAERRVHHASFLPAVRLGTRFGLAGGAHLVATPASLIYSASLRPSVRIIGGLEVAAEVARRSAAPDGGELTALRGEAGWRFDERFLLALGFTAFGYAGTGLDGGAPGSRDRLYLRAEVGY